MSLANIETGMRRSLEKCVAGALKRRNRMRIEDGTLAGGLGFEPRLAESECASVTQLSEYIAFFGRVAFLLRLMSETSRLWLAVQRKHPSRTGNDSLPSTALGEGVATSSKGSGREAAPKLEFETTLWAAADKLRGNMDAAEYKHVALGLIFLKYISDRFAERRAQAFAENTPDLSEEFAEDRDA
jgi:hypothetical protein